MEHHLTWTKGLFESSYQLFENGQIKSSLFFDTWKNEARCVGFSGNYLFKTSGFASPTTQIISENNEVIGVITYNSWKSRATVNMNNGEQFIWTFANAWHSQWTITDFKEKSNHYRSISGGGNAMSNNDDMVMLLAGLFIKEYYNRIFIFIIIIVVIIPIITRG